MEAKFDWELARRMLGTALYIAAGANQAGPKKTEIAKWGDETADALIEFSKVRLAKLTALGVAPTYNADLWNEIVQRLVSAGPLGQQMPVAVPYPATKFSN